MKVDLPLVQNPFLADPPSVPLRLMYAALAAASEDDSEENQTGYARLRSVMSEAYAVRILDAYQPQTVPAVRAHDGVKLLVATGS